MCIRDRAWSGLARRGAYFFLFDLGRREAFGSSAALAAAGGTDWLPQKNGQPCDEVATQTVRASGSVRPAAWGARPASAGGSTSRRAAAARLRIGRYQRQGSSSLTIKLPLLQTLCAPWERRQELHLPSVARLS